MNHTADVRRTIQALLAEFQACFIERDEEILGAILAILSNENILYLGPPGTAKTYLAQSICRSVMDADFFYYLLTRFTTPEEIFGPLSIKSLENDEFRRKTDGCLPNSHIALLDEIFKANSSILNSLLTILNERGYHNGTDVINTPVLTVFGASNELPEEDENLEALYDRFLFRYDIRYIQHEENVKSLLFGDIQEFMPSLRLDIDQIRKIRSDSQKIEVSSEVQRIILSLKHTLEQMNGEDEGLNWISDRRWKKIIGVLKVAALVNGDTSVNRTMLLLMQHMLWDLPQQKEEIRRRIITLMVSGGIDVRKLETGIRHLNAMLHDADGIIEDQKLPVPVYAHDSEGNHTKILTYRGLVEADKNGGCYYFTLDNSFSTCYQFLQVMGILQNTYGFSPEKALRPDNKAVCDAEYAYLKEQYQVYEQYIQSTIDHLKRDLDRNIWLTTQDRDEISCILQEQMSRFSEIEEQMSALTSALPTS